MADTDTTAERHTMKTLLIAALVSVLAGCASPASPAQFLVVTYLTGGLDWVHKPAPRAPTPAPVEYKYISPEDQEAFDKFIKTL